MKKVLAPKDMVRSHWHWPHLLLQARRRCSPSLQALGVPAFRPGVVRRTCIRSRPTSAAMVPTRKFPRPSDIVGDSAGVRPVFRLLECWHFGQEWSPICTCVVDQPQRLWCHPLTYSL